MTFKILKRSRTGIAAASVAACVLWTGASSAQDMGSMPGMKPAPATSESKASSSSAKKPAKRPPLNRAAELLSKPMLEAHMESLKTEPLEDRKIHSFLLFDLLEYRANSAGVDTFTWDFVGWVGGDFNRLWIKSEGDQNIGRGNGVQGDLQLLYGRLIAPFWDFQAGLRYNGIIGPDRSLGSRTYAVIGLQGVAPGNFDVEPALYISDRGEVSAEITVSADLYLTQRLVLQPRLEAQFSVQGDPKFSTGKGANQTDLGLRLRYEFTREIAPYIGVTWLRKYGDTADIARAESEPDDAIAFVAGLRLWY